MRDRVEKIPIRCEQHRAMRLGKFKDPLILSIQSDGIPNVKDRMPRILKQTRGRARKILIQRKIQRATSYGNSSYRQASPAKASAARTSSSVTVG